eukprot:1657581-Rhodomonas_salina.3
MACSTVHDVRYNKPQLGSESSGSMCLISGCRSRSFVDITVVVLLLLLLLLFVLVLVLFLLSSSSPHPRPHHHQHPHSSTPPSPSPIRHWHATTTITITIIIIIIVISTSISSGEKGGSRMKARQFRVSGLESRSDNLGPRSRVQGLGSGGSRGRDTQLAPTLAEESENSRTAALPPSPAGEIEAREIDGGSGRWEGWTGTGGGRGRGTGRGRGRAGDIQSTVNKTFQSTVNKTCYPPLLSSAASPPVPTC